MSNPNPSYFQNLGPGIKAFEVNSPAAKAAREERTELFKHLMDLLEQKLAKLKNKDIPAAESSAYLNDEIREEIKRIRSTPFYNTAGDDLKDNVKSLDESVSSKECVPGQNDKEGIAWSKMLLEGNIMIGD